MCFLNAPAQQLTLEEGRRAGPRRKERPACSSLTHLVKHPVTWSSYCSHNTIWILDHVILRLECKQIAVMYFNQATHPAQPRQRQREDELEACSPALSSAFQRKPARSSCIVLGEHLAQDAHDKYCLILDLFEHKRCQSYSISNFINRIVTGMTEFIYVWLWDLCNDK